MSLFFLFLVGAAAGSFLGALTWRWPRDTSIAKGRSRCPHCNRIIRWHDNLPIISYLLLNGKCRDCKKPIPRRDFLIEVGTALAFPLAFTLFPSISINIPWISKLPMHFGLSVFLIILAISIAIFVIDLEHQYIPDTLVFVLLGLVILVFLATNNGQIFIHLLGGFGAALFLLLIHLATLGRGMGLGDVKLALAIGMVLGTPLSIVWMFSAFILGSVVGVMLIILKLAKFKQRIAFGPFLILGFIFTLIFGAEILNNFYPIY